MKNVSTKELIVVLAGAVGALLAGGAALYKDQAPEWKSYQAEFVAIVEEELGVNAAAALKLGVRQIWVEDLDVVDRCTTCHMGVLFKGLERVEQPWRTHPNLELFEDHPLEEFGCTPCHAGQGWALTTDEAHGFAAHWPEPLLSDIIGEEYDPRTPPPLHETRCNYCHRYERETPGLEYVNLAKEIVRDKGCKVCHVINGSGGKLGPDLTFEGDKHAEEFDFSNLVTEQVTVLNWHVKHFQSPATVVPASIMPELNLRSKEAQALALLVLSWRDDRHLPRRYLPGVELHDAMTPEEIERDRRMREGDGAFFVKHSCFVCHAVEAFGIESPTEKGPDLSWAPEDVRARFSKTVEEFLFAPTGTMKIILESQIPLTDEEKWEAVGKINRAYDIVKNRADEKSAPNER